jgi:hypothetical protein
VLEKGEILSHDEKVEVLKALQAIQKRVSWKSGKDQVRLKKRQRMVHLSPTASISDYDQVIFDIVRDDNNVVYLYEFGDAHYYAVRGFSQSREWLVIFVSGGVIETAFPPEDMDGYLERRGFVLLGYIKEILQWTKKAKN